ncbi:phosphotransferase family enzyme [Brevirhabdus pacifica]|uniref:phosphotransferase family protein n=2 Tax=Brevirhabdus pacifica TaxID=1267768 RepID=UPI0009F888E8|nr:aminoglycoside phosphotransferase family protein [Brevirhabdus pacifica]PJJ82812.1 phosphotransferase family enzyme [Brevirhabdus pacifica]
MFDPALPAPAAPRPLDAAAPPPALARLAAPWLEPDAGPWQLLTGGRTNRVWAAGDVICKSYDPDGATPLFANDAGAEAAILRHLSPNGLAPGLLAEVKAGQAGDARPAILYRKAAGRPLARPNAALIKALSRVHALNPPAWLPPAPQGPRALSDQCAPMLAELPADLAADLRSRRPDLPAPSGLAPSKPALLHGDPVAANAIEGADGQVTLVDWQCPASGDPVLDLATALSPAMQITYGRAPLEKTERQALIAVYPEPGVRQRLGAWSALLHWRMAVYCAWRGVRPGGDPARARQAMTAELAAAGL